MTDKPDPKKVKVQLNIPITWEWMAHIDKLSKKTHIPKAQLVRMAIEKEYPIKTPEQVRQETRDAGATQ